MKIYTKKGDSGMTSLFGGMRLSKSDIRIEAYGTIDELNSFIGLLIAEIINDDINNKLLRIQKRLFDIGAILATNPDKPELIRPFNENEITFLEEEIDSMESELEPLKNFILPSGSKIISLTHIVRTVCRRAERRIVAIPDEDNKYAILIKYINRLSDYLFVLSRKLAKESGVQENIWD